MTARDSLQTAVITGATSGIGREVALLLAEQGMRVLGVGRSTERCRAAEAEIRECAGNPRVHFLQADLSSLSEVRRLAAGIQEMAAAIDVLVNNAGTFTLDRRLTVDGLETQLAVNWLSAFLLTGLLMEPLRRAGRARIVNLSSGSHFSGTMHWDDLGLAHGYHGLKAYDQSKLAMVLFTAELARRFGGTADPWVYAVDPGLVRTEIAAKGNGRLVKLVWKIRTRKGISPREAAESVAWCAVHPAAAGMTGRYWKERTEVEASVEARNPEAGRRLWEAGEELSGRRWPLGRSETAPGLIA
jgi:NAD(P)-dependent dehydrogenase (short-subunit alcohol dehydrogenase family)